MLRECEKPDCFDLEDGYMYFEACNKEVYGYMAIMFLAPKAMVHIEVTKWTHNILKNLYCDWDVLNKLLKSNGIRYLVITKEGGLDENKSYLKFLNKFGLPAPKQILIAAYELE